MQDSWIFHVSLWSSRGKSSAMQHRRGGTPPPPPATNRWRYSNRRVVSCDGSAADVHATEPHSLSDCLAPPLCTCASLFYILKYIDQSLWFLFAPAGVAHITSARACSPSPLARHLLLLQCLYSPPGPGSEHAELPAFPGVPCPLRAPPQTTSAFIFWLCFPLSPSIHSFCLPTGSVSTSRIGE